MIVKIVLIFTIRCHILPYVAIYRSDVDLARFLQDQNPNMRHGIVLAVQSKLSLVLIILV